jgi:hypothetical protein
MDVLTTAATNVKCYPPFFYTCAPDDDPYERKRGEFYIKQVLLCDVNTV